MRNNKNISRNEIVVGLKVKLALPTTYACHGNKDRDKRYSWWKGKVIEVDKNGSFVVYLGSYLGRMFISKNQTYKMVKCL